MSHIRQSNYVSSVTTIYDFDLNGAEAFADLVTKSEYGSLAQLVASLTVFSNPELVAETEGKAIFPIVRNFQKRGTVGMENGRLVGYDDKPR